MTGAQSGHSKADITAPSRILTAGAQELARSAVVIPPLTTGAPAAVSPPLASHLAPDQLLRELLIELLLLPEEDLPEEDEPDEDEEEESEPLPEERFRFRFRFFF